MAISLKDLIGLTKELPEECFAEAMEKLQEIKEAAEASKATKPVTCLHCGSERVVRNGKRKGRQNYLCRTCGRAFTETATSVIAHSHSSESVWKQVIQDTVDGVSIDRTAASLDLSHSTVFYMRHKILSCVEQAVLETPIEIEGVCEADETYVLESVKGRKIGPDYHRKPRKHGAKASRPGLSKEYLCVCTSVDNDNHCTAEIVNRASPSNADIEKVFGDKVSQNTVILCDGSTRYDVLDEKCTVAHTKHVNRVNGFHSFVKGRLNAARGVATIYLSRYATFFAQIFGDQQSAPQKIFELVTARNGSFADIHTVKNQFLLLL